MFRLLSKLRCICYCCCLCPLLEEVQLIRWPAWLCVAPKQSLCTALESHEGKNQYSPTSKASGYGVYLTAAKLWAPIFTSSNCTYAAAKATLSLALAPTQPVRMPIKHRPEPKKARKDGSDDDASNELETEKMEEASAQQTKTTVVNAIQLLKTYFTAQLWEIITSN